MLLCVTSALTSMLKLIPGLVFVCFFLSSTSSAAGDQIRLLGCTRCSGKVEIHRNNTWGTVCNENWDLKDAEVVCKHLNCGSAVGTLQYLPHGERTGQFSLMTCSGSKRPLTDCWRQVFDRQRCSHMDAGVICSKEFPKPGISMSHAGVVSWGHYDHFAFVPMMLLVTSAAVGSLLTLLVVFVVVFLLRRKRHRPRRGSPVVLSVQNICEKEDNYENMAPISSMQIFRGRTSTVEAEGEADGYEQPDRVVVRGAGDDGGEEDNEDKNNDYVNVSQ